MGRKKNRDRGPCVYCGKPATTDDHIPPQTIFGDEKPPDRIWVPACDDCNRGCSKDDEYFKQISLMRGIDNNSAADEVYRSVSRALNREQAKGMRRAFYERVGPLEVETPAGLYVSETAGCRMEKVRLNPVFNRIVRGLFWVHTGRRLPD